MKPSLVNFVRDYYEKKGFKIEEDDLFQKHGDIVTISRKVGKNTELFSIARIENHCYVIQELNKDGRWENVISETIK